ncbi:arginine--tRNA ligase [Alphaproteobacteria bacterium]|nr:arginine--tRNA ligase [Alphaproteobacteria bacterium]
MNIYSYGRAAVVKAAQALFADSVGAEDLAKIAAGPPKDAAHGDLTTNAAMVLARPLRARPLDIAEKLAIALRADAEFASVAVAPPGYVNITLGGTVWQRFLAAVLAATPEEYGRSQMGAGEKWNVEFISANPTGPMHIGHARGAVFGDVAARLLAKAGYDVCREYYVNDHGVQVGKLARSLYLRYEELITGKPAEIPEGLYPGDYMVGVAQALRTADGDKWLGHFEPEYFRRFAVARLMEAIKADVALMGIGMDIYSSENALYEGGKVDAALKLMEEKGLSYRGSLPPPKSGKADGAEDWEAKEQLLFRATDFGDDVDRPLVKSDGEATYFLSDIAYHLDKKARGYLRQTDVWGADHAGYVKRLTSAIAAVGGGDVRFGVCLCQIVHLTRNGEPFKMSKRAGTFITVADLLSEITADELRFYMLTRKNDAQMAFDVAKVKEQSKDNLVFYVQYAHARASSVLRKNGGVEPVARAELLSSPPEREALRQLSLWPVVVEDAAAAMEPHRITAWLNDMATAFHGLWQAGARDPSLRFVVDDKALTAARLGLVAAVRKGIASGLATLGVAGRETMESGDL